MNYDDDDSFEFSEEENEGFKNELRNFRNFPLYKKAMEIFKVVEALCVTLEEPHKQLYSETMHESALIIPAKLAGAYGSDSWLICMQNASIIRYHAEYLLTATSGMKHMSNADKKYVQVMRNEVEEFRAMFSEWVSSFELLERDEYTDDWGLFIRK